MKVYQAVITSPIEYIFELGEKDLKLKPRTSETGVTKESCPKDCSEGN